MSLLVVIVVAVPGAAVCDVCLWIISSGLAAYLKPRAARDNVLELQKPYPISCRRIPTHALTENVEQVKHVYILCVCVRV